MISAAQLQTRIEGSLAAVGSLRQQAENLTAINNAVIAALTNGGCIYTAGNGGSAAEALHLAEELIGRYRSNRPALRSICLNADPTALTCIANDFGYEHVFARQCQALLTPNDVLIVLSTSGNSANLVNALHVAGERGCTRIGLLGRSGGACLSLCDRAIVVPADDSAHIQEAHLVLVHLICEAVERLHEAVSEQS